VALLFFALLLACSKTKPVPSGVATRVVSLSPSTTEALFAIGRGPRLVGRSRYCDYPPDVKKLPQVGGYVDPSFEAILALKPDLVIGARGPAGSAVTQRLESLGVPTYFPPTESFAEIDRMLLGVGERTGSAGEAQKTIDAIHVRLGAIQRAVADKPRVRVLLVFGLEPLSVAGPGSFPNEMIEHAGGVNVVTQGNAYPTLGMEHVLALDPDVVINAAMAEERSEERLNANAPGWGRVRAITQNKIVTLKDESVLRPGPRIADGVALLARALHPEATIP